MYEPSDRRGFQNILSVSEKKVVFWRKKDVELEKNLVWILTVTSTSNTPSFALIRWLAQYSFQDAISHQTFHELSSEKAVFYYSYTKFSVKFPGVSTLF